MAEFYLKLWEPVSESIRNNSISYTLGMMKLAHFHMKFKYLQSQNRHTHTDRGFGRLRHETVAIRKAE